MWSGRIQIRTNRFEAAMFSAMRLYSSLIPYLFIPASGTGPVYGFCYKEKQIVYIITSRFVKNRMKHDNECWSVVVGCDLELFLSYFGTTVIYDWSDVDRNKLYSINCIALNLQVNNSAFRSPVTWYRQGDMSNENVDKTLVWNNIILNIVERWECIFDDVTKQING